MAESLAQRVGRLVSASFNAVVSELEDNAPQMLMEQALRELAQATDQVRTELGQQLAQKHRANVRLLEENARHETLGEQIELAVAQGRDDLAQAGIAEQLDIEAQLPVLENCLSDCQAREKELEGYIAALQAKQRELQAQLQSFIAQQNSLNTSPIAAGTNSGAQQQAQRAEEAFERAMQRATGLPGREVKQNAQQLAELEALARDNRIQERLAALKAGR
ncbi:PspA/IM30 family protein [Atopomonas hussainii]|uniref:PspA/IM30 family protein n=1 Tax=Atopomonas hussainii TaxID=1429083 RepID=UPI0009000FAC|nr:PspA/IM30 family protein [Atopomonas hussainii]